MDSQEDNTGKKKFLLFFIVVKLAIFEKNSEILAIFRCENSLVILQNKSNENLRKLPKKWDFAYFFGKVNLFNKLNNF